MMKTNSGLQKVFRSTQAYNSLLRTLTIAMALVCTIPSLWAQRRDLGQGFVDHGHFGNVIGNRGTVCTVDGEGNEVVLVWLFDRRYSYALAVIDAQTGEVEEVPRPIARDTPFASILSSQGRYYTYMGNHFLEFDPLTREFTFVQEGPARAAMSMTEDDNGVIWAAIYPHADIVSYDPATEEFQHYGSVSDHPSAKYPRSMATDDRGWVYTAISHVVGQIFMLNPESGDIRTVVEEADRVGGGATVFRADDGKVYGYAPVGEQRRQHFKLHAGEAELLDTPPRVAHKPYIAGAQSLRHYELPGGERIVSLDLTEGRMEIRDPESDTTRAVQFQISGGGGSAMSLTAAPDDTIAGGTYLPVNFFNYNPQTDTWIRRPCMGQWNVVARMNDRLYAAIYTAGALLEWDPAKEWVPTDRSNPDSNPRLIAVTDGNAGASSVVDRDIVSRPSTMLPHPDGRHLIYGGSPGYGRTGGGLVFYDTKNETAVAIAPEDLLPGHSPASLSALPDGRIVGGTTVAPSLGGVATVSTAELYLLDPKTREVQWRGALLDGARHYTDLVVLPDGMVAGIVDRTRLFVFDPEKRAIVHQADLEPDFGQTVYNQGPRIFIAAPDERFFILFRRGIAELNASTYAVTMLAEAPGTISNGGAYLDGRLYFSAGANLLSWEIPSATEE